MWCKQDVEDNDYGQFGCVQGRCREEALIIQQVTGYRSAAAGFLSALILFDEKNAFPSIGRDGMTDIVEFDD